MQFILLLILILLHLLYLPLNRQAPKFNLKSLFDIPIHLIPWTVWIYLSYYFLLPVSVIILWRSPLITTLLITQIFATAIASSVWWLFPTGVRRPKLKTENGLSTKLLNQIYNYDKDCNGLPSGHVMYSFISCFFLAKLFPQAWIVFYLILFAISLSTITTKQHYFIDMAVTLLITPAIIEVCMYIISL